MDIADDIAYGVHDLEDSIALNLVSEEQFRHFVPERDSMSFLEVLKTKYPDEIGNDAYGRVVSALFGGSRTRKRFISRLVHHFVTGIAFVEYEQFSEPLIRYRAKMNVSQREFLDRLQELISECVIKSPGVQHLEFKGQGMVVAVFEALHSDPERLLPPDAFSRYEEAGGDLRAICDFVAGMTDSYLLKTYERLFAPRMGSVFDKL